jgi:F-type H+-transporting ATPase subunit delta
MKQNRRTRRAARQLYRLCLVDGALDENRVRTAARHVARSGRRDALAILGRFQHLVKLDRDRHRARVESAVPLPADVRDRVRAGLSRLYGAVVDASFEDNPALIGGMRIQVGSDVYDGSVRGRLAALEARL